jgi:tellurite resistance protein TerC
MLALDLGVFNRKHHAVGIKEALTWSGVWISLALLFNLGIYFWQGSKVALEFLSGYLIEKSLSVDNIFVFILIFSYFKVKPHYQHKVLFYGILGALIMRAVLIFAGAALIERFHWIIYIFGAFLVVTGIKIGMEKESEVHPEKNPLVRLFKKIMPITSDYHEGRFFLRLKQGLHATPLFLVLLIIETTDLVFALDSIPAIFGVTTDPFIVYTSNVFAILGLRALYFALADFMDRFHYLKYGLALILAFVGAKMILSGLYEIPIHWALLAIVAILAVSVLLSVIKPIRKEPL